jgi:glucose-1-phosphate cytidylyltransferase
MINKLPVIILAGGVGTRLSEETSKKPKPMVNIGARPILWHLMKIFAIQGFSEFLIATGYKHEVILNWVESNDKLDSWGFDCTANVIFTGENTQTAGRVKKALEFAQSNKFMMTYGDGLANINLPKLLDFHNSHGKIATVTSVRPPARFGHIKSKKGLVTKFGEKNQTDAGWINGGFFVLDQKVKSYLLDEYTPFELQPINGLVKDSELMTYKHHGYWQPMDTLREKNILAEQALQITPPWLASL